MEGTERVSTVRRNILIAVILAGVLAAVAVVLLAGRGGGTVATVENSDPHAPRTVSKDILNAVDKITLETPEAELVAKGRVLFRSNVAAKRGESCQGCHTDGAANNAIGPTPHDPNVQGIDQSFKGVRDPPVLFGVAHTDPYFWIGNTATLNEVSFATIENHFKAEFQADKIAEAAALTAYMKTIKAPVTDFDRGTMSAAALRGEELFQAKAACAACHGGPDFTDNRVHDTFVPQRPGDTDPGRSAPPNGVLCPLNPPTKSPTAARPLDCAFNTPTLRGLGLANTGPYMHNGIFTTLQQVVSFYNTQSSIAPLLLTPQEQSDLVAYLKAL
jgi:cytochrome c peroxidase